MRIILTICIAFWWVASFAQNVSYFENISTKNGLPSNYIFCTAQDAYGYIWAGTDKGISRFDGMHWQTWDADNGAPGNYITQIYVCNTGGLWLCIAEKGLYHANDYMTKFVKVENENKNIIYTELDNEGNLMCNFKTKTANEIISNIIKWNNGKCSFILKNSTQENNVKGIKVIGNDLFTIKKIVPSDPNINYHIVPNNNLNIENSIFSPPYLINNLMIMKYGHLQKDTIIWQTNKRLSNYLYAVKSGKKTMIALSGEGLFEVSGATYKLYNDKNGLQNLTINHLRADKKNNLYISTLGGGIYILPNNNKAEWSNNSLMRQLQISKQKVYGIEGKNFMSIDEFGTRKNYQLDAEPLCFYIDAMDVYIGDFKGVTKYKINNGQLNKITNYLITAGISSIIKRGKTIYCSTYGNNFFALASNKNSAINVDKLPFSNIEKLYNYKSQFVALSHEAGFFISDSNKKTITHFTKNNGLLNNYCSAVYAVNDTLIIGCKNGISILQNEKIIANLNEENGFKGKVVKEICANNKGQIFVMSDRCLHILKNKKLETIGNSTINIQPNEVLHSATFDSITNQIIIGTSNRVLAMVIPNDTIESKPSAPKIKRVYFGNTIVQKPIDFIVGYDNKQIDFELLPIEASLIPTIKSYYKLNEANWVSITADGKFSLSVLRAGTYTLIAKCINADGIASYEKTIAIFTVQKPWWERWWFISICIICLGCGLWYIAKYLNHKKKLQEEEQLQKLEQERQRISRDLHDNMGAFTSALIANVQQLKSKIGDNAEVQKMQNNAEQILSSLRETIWVLKNKEIKISEFSDSFKNYMFKILKSFEDINFDTDENIEKNILLPTTVAVHINKIMQETIQNIIKHANAKKISYTIQCNNTLEIIINDDGKGFDINTNSNGNGLENMAWRATEADVNYEINSIKGKGTVVKIVYSPKQ